MCFSSIESRSTVSAHYVYYVRNRLKMKRINAPTVSTEMIYYIFIRDTSKPAFIGDTMSQNGLTSRSNPVSISVCGYVWATPNNTIFHLT